MKLACLRSGRLLAARQAGLGEADRLWLEDHLGGCAGCRTDAALLAGMTRVVLSEDSAAPRRSARVDRAVAAALAAPTPSAAPARRVPWMWPTLAFAALAATTVVVLTRSSPTTQVAEPEAPLAPVRPEPAPTALVDGHYQLAHAEVDLSEGADGVWMAGSHQVILHRGRLRAQVDKAAQERFAVVTPQFVVEVIGTRFEVAADSVTVEEGVVHVLATDGQLLAEVRGGGRWSLVPASAERPDRPAPSPPDVGRELAAARKKLAARDVEAARRHLERARGGQASTAQQAETETLTAEIHLVEGKKGDAAAQYLRVSERFTGLPAGENALWAAASLRARLGELQEARALAERYLKRYPAGRFHVEARALAGR